MMSSLSMYHIAMVNSPSFGAAIKAINGVLKFGSNPSDPSVQQNCINLYKS